MNPGPLRRLVGFVGLLAVAPIALLLFKGAIDPVVAAQRALVVLLVVVVVGRIASSYLHAVARRFDTTPSDADAAPRVVMPDQDQSTA